MYTIVYVSTVQPYVDETGIEAIFSHSERINNKHKIGGILMYSEGNFFQILEIEYAKKHIIIDLFEKIKKDPRHYNVIKIFGKKTTAPSFSKYHTSFNVVKDSSNIRELFRFLKNEKKYNPEGYSEIAYLAQKFLALI
ncbi:MAG: BLUF domain-containing protein [Bacteroidota bacterium]